jgi:hypothetical protein
MREQLMAKLDAALKTDISRGLHRALGLKLPKRDRNPVRDDGHDDARLAAAEAKRARKAAQARRVADLQVRGQREALRPPVQSPARTAI